MLLLTSRSRRRLQDSSWMCSLCLHFECSLRLRVWGCWLPGHALALEVAYSQRLDGLQRGKEPLADGLKLVVV